MGPFYIQGKDLFTGEHNFHVPWAQGPVLFRTLEINMAYLLLDYVSLKNLLSDRQEDHTSHIEKKDRQIQIF